MEKVITMIVGIINMLIPNFVKSDSTHGIKETDEALIAINETGVFLAGRFADGVGFDDGVAFVTHLLGNEEYKKVLADAYDKYNQIPAELKDIDIAEGLTLAKRQLEYVPKILDALKKKA